MARKSGKSTSGSRKKYPQHYFYVNEKGRIVPRNYQGKVYTYRNGEKIYVGNRVPAKRTSDRKSQAEDYFNKRNKYFEEYKIKEHEQFTGNSVSEIFITKRTKPWDDPAFLAENKTKGKSTDDQFVFSPTAYSRYGLNEKKQREYYELFKEANEHVEMLREETDNIIGAKFSYKLDVPPDVLQRRVDAALDVMEDDYVEKLVQQSRTDFFDAFSNFLDHDKYILNEKNDIEEVSEDELDSEGYFTRNGKRFKAKELIEIMEDEFGKLSDYQFLELRRKTNTESLAYALQSIVETYQYSMVIEEVKRLIGYAREGKGLLYH